jgi:glycosyltransferase involved in cell wall biosynthesis
MMNKVSIILPNYNHALYLPERLNSIFNQTHQDFEVIILDDCSTDNSLQILKKYKNHPKVSHFLVNDKNTGSPFKQWEKGLKLTKGDYIWIAESDDTCENNFLETQLKALKEKQADIAVAKTLKLNSQGPYGTVNHPIFKNKEELTLSLDYFLYCPILNVSATVFKKKLIEKAQTFRNYRLIGDRVFYFEAFHDKKIVQNLDTVSYFRKEEDSVSTLSSKGLHYLKLYYKEHQRFAATAYNQNMIDKQLYNAYIKRFFNRVNNRLSRKQKLNLTYVKLRLQFNKDLK